MAELNLNQIIDKLNEEFVGDARKLVFWCDDNGDFAEDMDKVNCSEGAKDTDRRAEKGTLGCERITNENILVADSRNDDPAKQITRLRFTFKNQKYDRKKH